MTIQTVTIDTYPTRYGCDDHLSVWVESTHPLASRPGHEVACYRELTQNPAFDWDTAGVHATIVLSAANGKCHASCSAYGPNQYRRQIGATINGDSFAEVKAKATEWIETVARPWEAKELANQVDYVEVTDPLGKVHTGQLWGVTAGEFERETWVKLDNPAAYTGFGLRGERVRVPWSMVRRAERCELTFAADESGQYRLAI